MNLVNKKWMIKKNLKGKKPFEQASERRIENYLNSNVYSF